jgi:hypothetical protein
MLRKTAFQYKISSCRKCGGAEQKPSFSVDIICGSADPYQSTNPTSPLSKSTPNCLRSASLPQFPLIIQDLAFASQLPSQVFKKNVPYGKIIQTSFSTQPFKMLPGFPVPMPGIVVLTAGPIFHAAFDSYFLKIVHENPAVISHEGFQRAGFCEI